MAKQSSHGTRGSVNVIDLWRRTTNIGRRLRIEFGEGVTQSVEIRKDPLSK